MYMFFRRIWLYLDVVELVLLALLVYLHIIVSKSLRSLGILLRLLLGVIQVPLMMAGELLMDLLGEAWDSFDEALVEGTDAFVRVLGDAWHGLMPVLIHAWHMFTQLLRDSWLVVAQFCDALLLLLEWAFFELVLVLGVCTFWEFVEGGFMPF